MEKIENPCQQVSPSVAKLAHLSIQNLKQVILSACMKIHSSSWKLSDGTDCFGAFPILPSYLWCTYWRVWQWRVILLPTAPQAAPTPVSCVFSKDSLWKLASTGFKFFITFISDDFCMCVCETACLSFILWGRPLSREWEKHGPSLHVAAQGQPTDWPRSESQWKSSWLSHLKKHLDNNMHLFGFCFLKHFHFYGFTLVQSLKVSPIW